jgi:hypothetical protein
MRRKWGARSELHTLARFISPGAFEKIGRLQAADSPLASHIHQFSLPNFLISAFD